MQFRPNLFKNATMNKFKNKKTALVIKNKYQKRYKLFSDFRYVSSSFKFSKIKFYKKKIKVLKKYYSFYTSLNTKKFNKLIEGSIKKNDFLIERRLDIFLSRNFGGSLVQKRQELSEGRILVNGGVKSENYLLQDNDFIYWVYFRPWKLKRIKKKLATVKKFLNILCLKNIPGIFFFKTSIWDLAVKRNIWQPIIRSKSRWQLRIRKDLLKSFWNEKNIKYFLYKKKI